MKDKSPLVTNNFKYNINIKIKINNLLTRNSVHLML